MPLSPGSRLGHYAIVAELGAGGMGAVYCGADNIPVWFPDGRRIAFVSNRDGGVFNLYVKDADGTAADELLLKTPHNKVINDWSADGRYILYSEDDPATKADLWVLVADAKPIRVVATPCSEFGASFSPDGRWIAYTSDESGLAQVFVQSFPLAGSKWQVSTTRGSSPRWRPDGKELFFDSTGTLMAVDLTGTVPGGAFKHLKLAFPSDCFRDSRTSLRTTTTSHQTGGASSSSPRRRCWTEPRRSLSS